MMNDRSDYAMMTPPQSVAINGGIMPARDVAGGSSWKHLRGEDPCFLCEAARRMFGYRRYLALSGFDPALVTAPTDAVEASVLSNLVTRIHSVANSSGGQNWVCVPTPTINDEYNLNVGGTVGFTIAQNTLASGMLSPVTFYADALDFQAGGPLVADNLRKLWFDYRKFGSVVSVGSGWMEFASGATDRWRSYYANGTLADDTSSAYSSGRNRRVYRADHMGTGVWPSSEHDYNWTLSTVNPYNIGASGPKTSTELGFAAGDDALAIFSVEVLHQVGSSGSVLDEHFFDSFACWGQLDGNGILQIRSLGGGSVTGAYIKALVYDRRPTLPTRAAMPTVQGQTEMVEISLNPNAAVFYDAEINTSSINWQWTPT